MILLFCIRVLNKLKLLPFFNFTTYREINGVVFQIPLIGRTGFDLVFENETWMDAVLRKVLPLAHGKVFIDVGVNLGQTLLSLKSIQSSMDYVGFEPNPTCVQLVLNLIEKNRLEKTAIVPAAFGKDSGLAILYKDQGRADDSMASIVKEFRDTSKMQQIIVPVISLSAITLFKERIAGVVKVDVEGGEADVIESLSPVLNRDRPFVICEILPVYSAENTFRLARQERVLALMQQLGYLIFSINPLGGLNKVDSIGVHSDESNSNYLFCPTEWASKINLA
jgi:FkbM family methyltransferase